MIHEILPVGMLQCNCSILGDEASRQAIVVDPGDDIEQIVSLLDRHQLRVQYIVITHAHIDHIGGAKKLKDLTGAPVYMNERDMEIYGQISQQAAWIGMPTPERTAIDVYVRDGGVIRWGEHAAHSPPHARAYGGEYLLASAGRRRPLGCAPFDFPRLRSGQAAQGRR